MTERGSIRSSDGRFVGGANGEIHRSSFEDLKTRFKPDALNFSSSGVVAGPISWRAPRAAAPRLDAYVIAEPATMRGTFEQNAGDRPSGYALKRSIDIVGSLILLAFFGPLMLMIAFLIWALDRAPVIFAQERTGFGGRKFRILKFRSMYTDANDRLAELLASDPLCNSEWIVRQKLAYDPRITRLGRFLRVSSLDELPQLINVLRGDMSLVGPRPIVDDEHLRYGRYIDQYCAVRPGITGLWQVSGRNDTTYRRRVALDVVYSRRTSLGLDLWIFLMTIPAIFAAKGSY